MDDKKKLVAVTGLRRADPTTLAVLTQDVLRTPLVRIDPSTLCDLLALSELGSDDLPIAMYRELQHFQRQMFRELTDLPDGPVLVSFMADLMEQPAHRVPACLRRAVAELLPERRVADAIFLMQAFLDRVEGTPPEAVVLPTGPQKRAGTTAAPPVKRIATRGPAPTRAAATPASQVDDRRSQWIEADLLDRIKGYPSGLKESILIAGARHRAPWKDVSDKEVQAALRKLKREGRLRFTSGRWLPGS